MDYATAVDHAERARADHLHHGEDRAAARAQSIAGRALRLWGRHTEARDQLTAAVEVLRTDPDADLVRALEELAVVAVFGGSPDADRLTTEALVLGQALDVSAKQLSGLLLGRGIYLGTVSQRSQAIAYCRESVRLATLVGDHVELSRALVNLSDVLAVTDPAAAAEAARTALGHLRLVGLRFHLAMAITNLAEALMQLGDWDAAEAEYTQAVNSYGLADMEELTTQRGWLVALRGDANSAETMLATVSDLRASEDPQDQVCVSLTDAFIALTRGQPQAALRRARDTLAHADALGISCTSLRWAWPLAARAAHELGDIAAVGDLIALLDSYQPGYLAPMLRAERDLARVRLAAADGDDDQAATAFAVAIVGLRERSTPYHLAHGLLDHAEYLSRHGDAAAAAAAVAEARDIARRLRCQPLLHRADALEGAQPLTHT